MTNSKNRRLFSVSMNTEYILKKVEFQGKFGLVDQFGLWQIAPMFDDLGHGINEFFDEKNYCRAKLNGKYGFINEYSIWFVEPQFDVLGVFDSFDFCPAVMNQKLGFIGRNGKWIIPPNFDYSGADLIDSPPIFNTNDQCILSREGHNVKIDRQGNIY